MKQRYDIGLEIEFANKSKETMKFSSELIDHKLEDFNIEHDGSSETPNLMLDEYPVTDTHLLNYMLGKNFRVCGGELTSPILRGDINEWQKRIFDLCDLFKSESYQNSAVDLSRCSIHVHINLADPTLRELKNLVSMALAYEPFLYKISGFGYENRCVRNNFVFSRPLAYPPYYSYNKKYYPVFNVQKLLASKSVEEFFLNYYNSKGGEKYVPQRYVGMNFYSILIRGSIEFRYANFTNNPNYLIAWIKLCQQIAKKSSSSSVTTDVQFRDFTDTSVFTEKEFLDFLAFVEISEPYTSVLKELWNISPDIEKTITPCLTHVRCENIYPETIGVENYVVNKAIPGNVNNYRDIKSDKESDLLDRRESLAKERPLKYKLALKQHKYENLIIGDYEEFWSYLHLVHGVSSESPTKVKFDYVKKCLKDNIRFFLFPTFSDEKNHTFTFLNFSITFGISRFMQNLVSIRFKEINSGYIYDKTLKASYDKELNAFFFLPDDFMKIFRDINNHLGVEGVNV